MYTTEGTPYIWTITERFYSGQTIYMRQHDRYEELVAQYVERYQLPRQEIRLEPKELYGLLRFKDLELIRDQYLLPLKDASHALFRTSDTTDFLDRLVNDIFHEISILKEEHYNVLTYSTDEAEREELDTILNEVHEIFPIKVHRLRHLFDLARERMERLLPVYRQNGVLIRSLFLYRDAFVAEAYPDGLVDFYRLMYGEDQPYEGYLTVGESFQASGFYEKAIECYEAGQSYLDALEPGEIDDLDHSWKDCASRFTAGIEASKKKLEELEV